MVVIQPDAIAEETARKADAAMISRTGEIIKKTGTVIEKVGRAAWDVACKTAKGAANMFRTAPMEYITFIVFIIILLTGILWLAFSDNSPLRNAGGSRGGGGGGGGGGIIGGAQRFLANLNVDTSWLYRFRGNNGDALANNPRSVLREDGRCDGVKNIDVSDGSNAICLNPALPKVIEWNLDPTQLPEWKSLPLRVQERLRQAKNGTTVYIPWGTQEESVRASGGSGGAGGLANPFASLMRSSPDVLVPQCSKAYFGDGTSAASLFVKEDETGTMCRLKTVENKPFGKRTMPYEEERPGPRRPVNRGEDKECTVGL